MARHTPSSGDPLAREQIEIANEFHRSLTRWQTTDGALRRMRERMPERDAAACLLKCVAINSLYGTNILAVTRMAEHLERVLAGTGDKEAALVERIARVPANDGHDGSRNVISFASKFCHFFVDEEKYPIFDSVAQLTLRHHLGAAYIEDETQRYHAFCQNLQTVRRVYHLDCSNSELDHYLWITGIYIKWLAKKPINSEMRAVLESPTRKQDAQLRAFLPISFRREFGSPKLP